MRNRHLLSIFTLVLLAFLSFAKSGLLFNVLTSGNNIAFPVKFELCLNARAKPVSCQQFITNRFNLLISTTVLNHVYPYAGIKLLNSSEVKIANIGSVCHMNTNGFCIFSVSNSSPVQFNILYNTGIQLSPSQIPNAIVGQPYYTIFTALNGIAPYQYTVQGSLPGGLTLNSSTGVLSGTPTTAGVSNFTIQVTDSSNPKLSASNQYSIYVSSSGLSIAPFSPLPNGTTSSAYSQTFTASGGTSPYTYGTYTNSSFGLQIPPGLSFSSSSGILSGTPTQVGTYNFYITAQDSAVSPKNGSVEYLLSINGPLQITPATLPVLTINQSYSFNFQTTGGTAPYTYSLYQGSLPYNMTLQRNGTLSGTPLLNGIYPIVIKSIDAHGLEGIQSYSLNVISNIFITPTTLPSATINTADSQIFQANGGTAPYYYYITSYNAPDNLSLNATTGQLSGTPTVPGAYPFSITAVDSQGYSSSQNFTLQVNGNILIYPTTLPAANINESYNQTFNSTGGTSYTYTYTGNLPPGIILTSAGQLTGTPTVSGTYDFSIISTDVSGNTGIQTYSFVVKGTIQIIPSAINLAYTNTPYSQRFYAVRGTSPYTFTVSSGQLPPGLSLNSSTGVLSGTPLYGNNYIFSITATDAVGGTGTNQYSLPVNQTLILSPGNNSVLPNAILNAQYSTTISASSPSAFRISSSDGLPPGCALSQNSLYDSSATIECATGPTKTGVFRFTVEGTSLTQGTSYANYTLLVNGSAYITPTSVPNGQVNTNYTYGGNTVTLTLNSVSALTNVSFALYNGELPPGLTLNSNTPSANQATITGTPSYVGSYVFTIQATYTIGSETTTTTQPYHINISGGTLTISPAGTTLTGTINIFFSQQFTASNGNPPYTYALSNSNLPSTITLDSNTGVLSGTPTETGNYAFTIKATDSSGQIGSQGYTLNVRGPLSITPTTLTPGMVDINYLQVFTASGGIAPYTFSLISGNLPPGTWTFTSNGSDTATLSGVANAAGSYDFEILVQDSSSVPVTLKQPYNLTIATVLISPNSVTAGSNFNICPVISDSSLGTCTQYASSILNAPSGSALSQSGYIYSVSSSNGNVYICSLPNNSLSCYNFDPTKTPGNTLSGTTLQGGWNVAIYNDNYLYITYPNNNMVVLCEIVPDASSGQALQNCQSTSEGFTFPYGLNIYNNKVYIANIGDATYQVCSIGNDGSLSSCTTYTSPINYMTSFQFNDDYAYFTHGYPSSVPSANYIYKCPLKSDGSINTDSCINWVSISNSQGVLSTAISNSAYYFYYNQGTQMNYVLLSGSSPTLTGNGFVSSSGNSTFG